MDHWLVSYHAWNVVAAGEKARVLLVPNQMHPKEPSSLIVRSQHRCMLLGLERSAWGTLKNTTITGVANTLKVLGKVPVNALIIKRKYKTAKNNSKRVVRWWFVIRGEENILQNNWSSVSIQTGWKLEQFQTESMHVGTHSDASVSMLFEQANRNPFFPICAYPNY